MIHKKIDGGLQDVITNKNLISKYSLKVFNEYISIMVLVIGRCQGFLFLMSDEEFKYLVQEKAPISYAICNKDDYVEFVLYDFIYDGIYNGDEQTTLFYRKLLFNVLDDETCVLKSYLATL